MKNKILFLLQYDSFISTLIPVIKFLIKKKYSIEILLYKATFKKTWINNEIVNSLGVLDYEIGGKLKLKKILKKNPNILVFGSVGSRLLNKIYHYKIKHKLTYKIVSGYAGALLNNNPQGFLNGLNRRSISDLIWLPGSQSKKIIQNTKIINPRITKLVNTGLPRFDELFKIEYKGLNNTILFLEQPTFPKSKNERKILVNYLFKLSKIYSEYNFIVKPRFRVKIKHAHSPKYLIQDLIINRKDKPDNIHISYDHIYFLFEHVKFCLTISSTAGLEAMLKGIPTYFISDFCKKNNLYGTDYFVETNAVVTFKDLVNKNLPTINYSKVLEIFKFDGKNTVDFSNSIIDLLND